MFRVVGENRGARPVRRAGDLVLVGYWYSEEEPMWPHPADLVDEAFYTSELKANVTGYLRRGQSFLVGLGHSWCRFDCGVPDQQMGRRDLTDGVWVWPQGLAHYVEQHAVRLPDEFIATMRQNDWGPPTDASVPRIDPNGRLPVYFRWWREWKPPWKVDPIAATELFAVAADGTRHGLRVVVGRPYESGLGEWRCPVSCPPLLPETHVAGEDSFQALMLAASLVRQRLDAFADDGGKVKVLPGGEDDEDDQLAKRTLDAVFGGLRRAR